MSTLEIYCITNKHVNFLQNINLKIGWVGKEEPLPDYISCNDKNNIFYKEKYYSELTFQYWYWKNLNNLNHNKWIGFCQKRRFWIKPESENKKIDIKNINEHLLLSPHKKWENYDAIIMNPININGAKKIKMLKKGWRSLIKKPSIFFNKENQSILSHFDMHHGYRNTSKAIEMLDIEDKEDFRKYVNTKNFFNPHIMFIAKPYILDKWFTKLFSWLSRCEKEFGFEKLAGYETTRLYAYLAERYLSFWFKKYTRYLESPWIFLEE